MFVLVEIVTFIFNIVLLLQPQTLHLRTSTRYNLDRRYYIIYILNFAAKLHFISQFPSPPNKRLHFLIPKYLDGRYLIHILNFAAFVQYVDMHVSFIGEITFHISISKSSKQTNKRPHFLYQNQSMNFHTKMLNGNMVA